MIGVHTVAEIRAAEAALMAELPEGALMQRAATGLAAACARLLDGPYGARIVLLVGAGDNGGDALWAGAKLARRGAYAEAVLLRPDKAHGPGLAAFRAAGGQVRQLSDAADAIARADLVLDGIAGIGGRSGLDSQVAGLATLAHERAGLVVAVDLPSGVSPDTGEADGAHVIADLTVTFGAAKVALLVDPAANAAGRVHAVDIGLAPYLPAATIEVMEPSDIAQRLGAPERDADKYSRGVVGVLAGSGQFTGAAVLAVGGAVRGGAGMVRYSGPHGAAALVRARWPEAIVTTEIERTGKVQAWVVGSGLGDGRGAEVEAALTAAAGAGLPVVVDADGLRSLPSRFDGPALLTPHAGELARMLGVERADIEARRLHNACDAARRWNATVLLKGTTTLVVTPDGRARVNPTGTSALATAGTGDVLAGLAGSLLATGLDPLDAGSVAAHVHGVAGRLAARASGFPSASDVLNYLPAALLEESAR